MLLEPSVKGKGADEIRIRRQLGLDPIVMCGSTNTPSLQVFAFVPCIGGCPCAQHFSQVAYHSLCVCLFVWCAGRYSYQQSAGPDPTHVVHSSSFFFSFFCSLFFLLLSRPLSIFCFLVYVSVFFLLCPSRFFFPSRKCSVFGRK